MKQALAPLFTRALPLDIVHHILDFYGNIRYKNGEYINIIHKHDERYEILRKTCLFTRPYYYTFHYAHTLPEHFECAIEMNDTMSLRIYNLYVPPTTVVYSLYKENVDGSISIEQWNRK